MTLNPRESGEFISANAKHVFIKKESLPAVAEDLYKRLENKEIRVCSSLEQELFPKGLTEEEAINYMFLLDAINFCFWARPGQPRYYVNLDGQQYTGYFALCAAVMKVFQKGIQIHDPAVYSGFSLQQVKDIFRGENDVQIPLVEERWKCMKEVGNMLLDKYDGQFANCVKQVNKSAEKMLQLIVTDFPCFNDTATYLGKTVSLHKRAQIVVGDVWSLREGQGLTEFEDIDVITMFADYRVPQVLLSFGILQYSEGLMDKLKKGVLLENGSVEEVEIRGCSIQAVELLLEELREFMKREGKKEYYCNSIMIDNFLWGYRREHAERLSSLPFHRTLCIYY